MYVGALGSAIAYAVTYRFGPLWTRSVAPAAPQVGEHEHVVLIGISHSYVGGQGKGAGSGGCGLGSDDSIERGGEFAIAVADQEAKHCGTLAEV
jgi:hypothetical protein